MKHLSPGKIFLAFAFGLVTSAAQAEPLNKCDANLEGNLRYPRPKGMYDKALVSQAIRDNRAVVFGTELNEANVNTATTIINSGGIGTFFLDGLRDNPADITNLNNALNGSPAIVLLKLMRPDDYRLKQNLDAGALGAILKNPESPASLREMLDHLYYAPIGNRPVGPSKVNDFLDVPDFTQLGRMEKELNDLLIGGVEISQAQSLELLIDLAALKIAGLRLIILDREALAREWQLDVHSEAFATRLAPWEQKISEAQITMATKIKSREEALTLVTRGYRHFILGSDHYAIETGLANFQDVPQNNDIEISSVQSADLSFNAKQIVEAGKMLHATFLMTPDLAAAEVLAQAEPSIWIDAEHGPFSPPAVLELIKNLKSKTRVIVRVPQYNNPHIARYIRAGAQGIVAPNINSIAESQAFVHTVKKANAQTMSVIIIETQKGLDDVEHIVTTPGVDVVHIGPFDLANSMRVARDSPEHKAAIARIEAAARNAGKPLGGLAGRRSKSYEKFGLGYRFLTTISDQEAIALYFKANFPPQIEAQIIEGPGSQGYYSQPIVIRQEDIQWNTDADGVKVAIFHAGPNVTIQIASKTGAALIDGASFPHSHPQGQLTLILRGQSYFYKGDEKILIKAGDFVYVPPGVAHKFEDINGGGDSLLWMDIFDRNRFTGRPHSPNEKELHVH